MAEPNGPAQSLIVEVGGTRYAVPAASVVEVIREPRITRAPGAPLLVAGLVNHRGRILAVGAASRVLDPDRVGVPGNDLVVVDWEKRRFGLLVDQVVELASVRRTEFADLDLARMAAAVFG